MTTAWNKGIAIGLLMWPMACEVSVNDDLDAVGGTSNFAGSPGNGGRSGQGGTSNAGSSGTGGQTANGGTGGADPFPVPTCSAETGDDECVQCLKQNCCTEWRGCDDRTCFEEWNNVAECVLEYDFPGEDEYGMCLTESSAADDGFVQPNTLELLSCATEAADDAGLETRCSTECLGTDIFFE